MSRARRVGTRLVKPVPAPLPPLLLDIHDDSDGEVSPLREAVIGWLLLVALVVVSGAATLWGLHQQGWFGL